MAACPLQIPSKKHMVGWCVCVYVRVCWMVCLCVRPCVLDGVSVCTSMCVGWCVCVYVHVCWMVCLCVRPCVLDGVCMGACMCCLVLVYISNVANGSPRFIRHASPRHMTMKYIMMYPSMVGSVQCDVPTKGCLLCVCVCVYF